MTAPKLDVQPGWRGTEDLTDAAPAPLEPEGYVTVPGFGKWLPRGLKYLFEQIGVPEGGCAVMEAVDAVLENRQPAPLDPGNPEHLRQVADALLYDANTMVADSDLCRAMHTVEFYLRAEADRLDREQREAEQDAAEADKLAAVLADFAIYDTDGSRNDTILAGHLVRRGVRVIEERQDVEKSVCVCGELRIPTSELSTTYAGTVHRLDGPCYVIEGVSE